MIHVTKTYLHLENKTFKAVEPTPITQEERERIKRNNPNTYKDYVNS